VLVGDVSAVDAVIRLREAFGAWRARPDAIPLRPTAPEPVAARRVLLVDKPDATQAQIRFGNVAIKRSDPDYLPAQVANTILGGGFTSKLIEELRVKRSLTYAAWSMFAARFGGGDFRLGTFTKNPTTVETLDLALTVEGDFRNRLPDRKALDKAKSYLRGQFPLRLETPDALAARLAEIEFYGLPVDELATFRRRIAWRWSSWARRRRCGRRSRRSSGPSRPSRPTRARSSRRRAAEPRRLPERLHDPRLGDVRVLRYENEAVHLGRGGDDAIELIAVRQWQRRCRERDVQRDR